MEFPVDLLADYSQGEQERLSEEYMKSILCTNPDALQKVTLANRTQVSIGITNVGFVPLYGTNDKQKVLALFCPSDQLTAVALYLRNRWWTIDEILKTGDTARDGIMQVQTVGERVVLYTLNRVVYRAHEMSSEELPFLCHGEKDYAKVLWKNGEAVGFYSVKPPGSLCSALSTQCYQLPVMDSIFVRKCHRGNSFGVQMLEDFVSSFKDDCLGLRYPVSKAMFKVCETYLSQYPGDRDVLWQVEGVGSPSQRTNIANKIHTMNMSAVSRNLSFTEKSIVSSEVTETDVVMEEIASHNKNNESVEYTVQISEEVTVVRAAKVSEIDEIPVTTRVRSTGLKQRKMREETEEVSSTPTPDTTVLTPSEVPEKIEANMKQTLLDEEPQTLEVTSEIPKLQRAMVVIVDLKASCHEPQVEEMEEMTHIKKNIPAEKTDEEVTPSTVETQALRSKTKAVAEIPQKRRPLRERPEVDYEEARDDEIETAAVIDSNKDSVSVGDEEDNMKTVEAAPSTIEAQMDAALIEEALMAETDKELKKMAVVDTHEKEEMQCEETDEVSINFTSETAVTTLNEVPEQAEVGVSSSEEAEAPVAATRTLRDRKKTVEATPTRKSTRQKQVEEKKEKEVAAMESSNGKEEPVVERVLRRGRKSAAAEATPSSKSTISKQQEEKKDKEKTTVETNNDKEETVVETRGRRRGRPPKSAPGTPKCESKILSKQQKEAEVEEKEQSTTAEDIKVQEEDATVETIAEIEPKRDKETEAENTEQESETPEDESEEPEIEAEKEHTKENEVEKDKGEGVEAVTPEVEPAPVSVEEEEEVEGVTQEPLVSAVEMVEDEIVPSEEAEEVSPTPSPDSAIVTPSETAPVSVEEEEKVGMTQETPLAELVAEESQKVAAVDKVGDETNNEETVEESSALIPDTAVVIPSEVPETIEESTTQTLADEEPQREIPSQIPKLQRASVVLVDLKTSCHDRQVEEIEETTPIQQNVSAEKTDEKAPPSAIEEEVEMQAAVAEEPMAETDTDKKQMTAVVETFEKEIVQNEETDEMSTNLTTDSAVTTPTEVPEQAKIGVSSSEEAETPVASTSTLRDRKKSVEATPKRKSTRHKQQEEEKEEPVVETRVLRRGRKSAPAEATPSPKSTRSKQQEEKKDKEAAVVETKNSKEEPVVETTVLRRGRKSAPVAPKRESKRVRKQQKEAEDEEQEESITKAQEENFTVETPEETDKSKTVKEAEGENIEPEESGTPEDESKEPELEVLKENNKENEVETEKGEGVEAETQTTEVEPAPVSVKEEEKVEGVTEETPLAEPATEKSQEVSLVERVEDEIVHIVEAEEVSTTPNPDSAMVTPSEPATVSVEEQVGVTQETPLAEPATKESQEVTAVERVEDEITNNEETEEVGSTPAPDTAVVTPHEVPENIEDSMTQTPADEEPQKEVACQIPKLCENEIVQIEETNEVSTNVTTDCILTALSEVPEQAEIGVSSSEEAEVAVATTRTMRERKKAVEPAPRRKSTRKLEENKHEEEVAVESSNDEEEPVVETRVLRRGRKPASVKSTPIRKSTGSNPEEKKDEDEQVVEINNDKEEPVVETRVLRRGRKSAPVAPRRESKRVRKQLNEAEDEEQEEPTAEDIKVQEENATVETPAEIEDYKTDKETEGENIEQESVIPEDESEEPEIEAEKEHTKENELESEKREGVEPEPTPVSVEEEEQVEAVTQDPPLAEPATEESQEVAVGERLDDEMKQQQGEEKEEEEPVEAESQEAESPVVETRALRCRTKAVADSPQIKSKRRRLEVEEVGEVKPTKRRSVRGKPEVDYNENNEDEEAAPVSVEEEEQIEGVTQVAPLAEPATEESQEVAAVERVDDEIVQNEEAEDMSPTPKLQRTTVVLVDLKSTCQEPHVEHIDGTTPETKRRSMRERPEVDYDENSDDDIKTVSAEAVIDSNDEEDNVTELTANEETEKPVDEDTPQKRRSMRQKPEVDYDENKVTELTASEETEKPEEEEAANGIDVTNSISGESEEDNIIQLALEEDEEEEKAETAEEEGADELAISEESLIVGKRMLRGKKTSPPVTHSPSPKSQKVETRALRNRTKADADTPKIKSKRRHLDEEEVEEVEPPKRRSTRQRPEVDYSEDGDKTCPPVTLSSSAEPRRQSTKGKKAAQERKESSSDEEQEKISPSDKKRIVRKRTSIEPTPVRRSKRATNISE